MAAELEWAGKRWLHRLLIKMKIIIVYGMNNLETSIKMINLPTPFSSISLLYGIYPWEIKTVIHRHTNTFINNGITYTLNKKPEAK